MVLMEMHALVSTDNTMILMYMCGLGGGEGGEGERGRPLGTWVVDYLSISVHVCVCVCVCLSVVSG